MLEKYHTWEYKNFDEAIVVDYVILLYSRYHSRIAFICLISRLEMIRNLNKIQINPRIFDRIDVKDTRIVNRINKSTLYFLSLNHHLNIY